jgi:membrane-bound lytic murein transglycosylase D
MKKFIIVSIISLCSMASIAAGHDIIFCGEKIPVDQDFVANKLMGIIKNKIRDVNCVELRRRAFQYFPVADYYLKATGLPTDFKYLAIVESGFQQNLESPAGAKGFWQFMPATGREMGLVIEPPYRDDRLDINKSTYAACRLLAQYYLEIRKIFRVSSWVLTAAAYNGGNGTIRNKVKNQGTTDYFSLSLTKETAEYVYKIIAVKELFEYPQLYMNDFGFNVFSDAKLPKKNILNTTPPTNEKIDDAFSSMVVKVGDKNQYYPSEEQMKVRVTNISEPDKNVVKEISTIVPPKADINYKSVQAQIIGKYKKFKDGDFVYFELLENLSCKGGGVTTKNMQIGGQAWLIDGRIQIALGTCPEKHDLTIFDNESDLPGIGKALLKDKEPIILRVRDYNRE